MLVDRRPGHGQPSPASRRDEPSFSALLTRFEPSAIATIFNRAAALRASGRRLWDFSVGEPDFDTPPHIREAAKRAIDAGFTRYTDVDGTATLKHAAAVKFRRDNGLQYGEEDIVVAAGAKPLLAAALQVVLDPGDEVILSTPCWPSHIGMILVAGGVPQRVVTGLEQGFKMSPEQLEGAITPRTKVLILCSPSNPTGAVYSPDELSALGAVLAEHPQIWILSDDLYEHIVFPPARFATIAAVEPALSDRTLTVNGVSKAYAMTGWRIGFAGGPKDWIAGLRQLFSHTTGGPSSISQAAAVEALNGPQDFLATWAEVYRARRDLALEILNDAPGLNCARPEGAFYLLPNCGGLIGRITPQGGRLGNSADLASYLLEDWGVVIVPGRGFDCDPYFRLSVATSDHTVRDGMRRLAEACQSLH